MSTKKTVPLAQSGPMAAFLAARNKMADLRSQEQQLVSLIEGKHQEIADAKATIPDLSHLTSQRQELLADLAMGKATDDQVATMDREIAAQKTDSSKIASQAKTIIEAAEQAVAGLNRRLDSVRQEITALADVELNQRLVSAVLKYHAETLGEEYVKAAAQVNALYMRLMALHYLFQAQGHPTGFASHCAREFEIPSFNLESCKPHEVYNWPGNLFLGNIKTPLNFSNARDDECDLLRAAGLDCV